MHVSTDRPVQHTVHLERPLPVDIDDAVAAITGDTERVLTLAPFAPSGIEMRQTASRALLTRSVSTWERGASVSPVNSMSGEARTAPQRLRSTGGSRAFRDASPPREPPTPSRCAPSLTRSCAGSAGSLLSGAPFGAFRSASQVPPVRQPTRLRGTHPDDQRRPGRVRGAHALPDERPLILPIITATATEPTAVSSVRLDSITLRYLA